METAISIKCYYVEMDQLSAIKWTIMEKAKFGLHSLNAETKQNFFPRTAQLGGSGTLDEHRAGNF